MSLPRLNWRFRPVSRLCPPWLARLVALVLVTLAMPAHAAEQCYQSRWLDRHACEQPAISKVPYASLKQALGDYLDKKKRDGVLADSGMYFRDLEDGPHFGVNEYASFAAASLFKLPVVIQYLYLAEQDAGILQERLVVPAGMDFYYDIHVPPQRVVAGQSYTVDELLFRTMAYSDNVAFLMLRQRLIDRHGSDFLLQESYRQLGLVPELSDGNAVITVMRYSSLFKLIYSAAFLDSRMSEKLVKMMLSTTYDEGLVKGVPAGVGVAHKFGIWGRGDAVQLHDCGIVYYPGNPYALCVMTRGHSRDELAAIIAEVSRMVYAEVDARRGRRP